MMANVLIIDDDPDFCHGMSRIVGHMGHKAITSGTLAEGIKAINTVAVDAIFLDIGLPDGSGLSLLPKMDQFPSHPVIIIITGASIPDGAELAINNGAWDYIQKGTCANHISLVLKRALEYRHEHLQNSTPREIVSLRRDAIIGNHPLMQACLDMVAQCAVSDVNVLINGETGTGKELFARAIHDNSKRSDAPFVVVDCASLPQTLIESILFGHCKGAFTGACEDRLGLVVQAHHGTLFLDEVGELPLVLQRAFLRVLEERRVRPIGSPHEVECDFRLVAATNRDLEQMVAEGEFRNDLFFRIQNFHISIPPLRKRVSDIQAIAMHHMQSIFKRFHLEQKAVTEAFFEALEAYHWPGNVRELVNALERAIISAKNDPRIVPIHLPPQIRVKIVQATISRMGEPILEQTLSPQMAGSRMPTLQQIRQRSCDLAENQYLKELISKTQGDLNAAMGISGLSQSRLYALFKKHGLSLTEKSGNGN